MGGVGKTDRGWQVPRQESRQASRSFSLIHAASFMQPHSCSLIHAASFMQPHSCSLMRVPCVCVTCLSVSVASEHACSRVHNTHPPTYAHMCTLARTHAHTLDDFTGKHQSGDCPIRAAKGGGLHGNTRVGHGIFIELPLGLGLRKRRPHVCSYVLNMYVRMCTCMFVRPKHVCSYVLSPAPLNPKPRSPQCSWAAPVKTLSSRISFVCMVVRVALIGRMHVHV